MTRRGYPWLAVGVGLLVPVAARADALQTWNNTLLTIIAETSGQMADGSPEVAREMAIVETSMYGAAQAATADGSNVDAAVNQAAYSAMMALYTKPGIAGNPNTGNTDTLGAFFATNSATLSATLTSQINATFSSLGVPTGAAAADGLGAATNEFLARSGSLSAPDDADGSYKSIISSLNPANYAAGAPGFPLSPGANLATGVGVYLPLSTTTTKGHIAMTPTWGTVAPFVLSGATITGVENAVPPPPNVTGATYANGLMTTYCTGGVSSNTAGMASACGAAAAAGVNVTSAGVLQGVTVTSSILTLSATGALVQSPLTDNALFWNDPGTTVQPPGHWLDITDNSIVAAGSALSELRATQLAALVGDAEADAAVAVWGVKYQYNLWRPITAITGNDAPGVTCAYTGSGPWNATLAGYGLGCDASWKSYIATPPHPDYVAGHPAFSGAAATVLTDFFGDYDPSMLTQPISETSNAYCNGGGSTPVHASNGVTVIGCMVGTTLYNGDPANPNGTGVSLSNPGGIFVPGITETFENFNDASLAATDSRVNGGIHTPAAIDQALLVGDAVGADVFEATQAPEPASFLMLGVGVAGLGGLRRRLRGR